MTFSRKSSDGLWTQWETDHCWSSHMVQNDFAHMELLSRSLLPYADFQFLIKFPFCFYLCILTCFHLPNHKLAFYSCFQILKKKTTSALEWNLKSNSFLLATSNSSTSTKSLHLQCFLTFYREKLTTLSCIQIRLSLKLIQGTLFWSDKSQTKTGLS